MAKYFLGSVGSAEAFKTAPDGSKVLAFVSKTLTDSAVNVTITKDGLRGGTNAPVVTNFYHDPDVAITLTDILFKTSYVEAQLGAEFKANGEAYQSETLQAVGGVVTLSKTPKAIGLVCDTNAVVVWYTPAGIDAWQVATAIGEGSAVTVGSAEDNRSYCVRYLADDAQARTAIIHTQFVPSELFLIITVPIFAGDACSASQGKAAGTLTFEVPRFQLDGGQEFTFNMSQNTTMNLSGTALAVEDGCDINNSKLFRLIEVITGRTQADGLVQIMFDSAEMTAAEASNTTVEVYGVYDNQSVVLLDNTGLTFTITPNTAANISSSGVITDVSADCSVTANITNAAGIALTDTLVIAG